MNKKAQFEEAGKSVYWTVAAIAIGILMIGFVGILANYKTRLTAVPSETPAELIALRFTALAACFAYQDPDTLRVYPSVIDMGKLTPGQLDQCYSPDPEKGYKDINYQLKLGERVLNTSHYYNVPQYSVKKEVLIKDGEKPLYNGELLLLVQTSLPARPS